MNGSDSVNIDEFIFGCTRLEGSAKTIDMVTLMYENKRLADKFGKFFKLTEKHSMEMKEFEHRAENLIASSFLRLT